MLQAPLPEIVLLMGSPAAGKTSLVSRYSAHVRLNRDSEGGTMARLARLLEARIADGHRQFVLDNTFPDSASRAPFIQIGQRHGIPVRAVRIDTHVKDAKVNAALRMLERYGKILSPDEMKKLGKTDPNIFPPIVLYSYWKRFEPPRKREGFATIETLRFSRPDDPSFVNKALLLDYDDTLRRTISGRVCPWHPDDVMLLPNRREVLLVWQKKGYRLLGISNQGDVGRNRLSIEQARACFERTNELLGLDIEYAFCPHSPRPVLCYCRKPLPGLGLAFIQKYKLDRRQTIMVGDMKTDEEFADGLDVAYAHPRDFFAV